MSGAERSHLLPTYARVDLAFERGEGVWLTATNGERYLDFTSGVAVNALGHAHPHLVDAHHRAGQEALARLQSLPHSGGRAAGRAAVRGELRRRGVLRQFRRRGDGMRDQDGAQVSGGQRPAGALPHHHLRGRLPRPHAGDARRPAARRNISKASARWSTASTRCRSAISRRSRRAIGPETGGDPDRADHGRGRRARRAARVPARAARALRRAWPAADLRRGADRHRPHRRAVRLSAHRRHARHHGARQGARRRLSARRLPRHRRGRARA